MPARRRNISRRHALDYDAQAWLRGEPCGFFQFKSQEELEALWNEHGDTDKMFWRSRYSLPIIRAELEANEDAWLNSGDDDEYGFNSFFVFNYYNDDEKQALWTERGDKTRYRWQPGMRRPMPMEG